MPTDAIPVQAATVPIGRPFDLDASPTAAAELLGGRYHLVRLVGSGGMGDVYEAAQLSPVRRTVAVKLVRRGHDSDDIAPRLEAERQALARMTHPNIAVVHDAGTAPDGRPFVVMEFVPGVPITEYAADRALGVAERIELLRTVCAAVQHAHQKGIIHRDLKPGNVLVAHTDAGAVPKVIDFGLAKAVRAPLTADPRLTAAGMVVGTPLYMAPEQTDPAADVDTRADVFALGVILYELLTDSTPLDWQELQNADPAEQIRRVRSAVPPPPSERAPARHLCRDLDAVTLKALARDPADRYPTAAALADDLRRVLADEPISVGRTTARIRALRFIRRNRAAVATAALVFLALAAGVAGTSIGLARSVRAENAAKAALAQVEDEKAETAAALRRVVAEKAETAAALARVEAEKKKAQTARDHTREALDAATDLHSVALAHQTPQLSDTDRAQLARLATLIDRLDADAATPGERSALLARVGFLYEKLGDQPKAADANARAVAAADASGDPAPRAGTRLKQARHFALVGRFAEAEAAYRTAIELFPPLAADEQVTVSLIEAHEGLAQVHGKAGRFADSAAQANKAIAAAAAAKAAGRFTPDALHYVAQSHYHLGVAARQQGKFADALTHHRAALELYRDPKFKTDRAEATHSLAAAHLNLAPALSIVGKIQEAKDASRDAMRLAEGGLARFPGFIDLRMLLGTATNNLAGMHAMGGEFREALPLFTKGIDILEPLAGGLAADQQAVHHYLKMGQFGRGVCKLHLNDPDGAEADFLAILRRLDGDEKMNFCLFMGVETVKIGRHPAVVARLAEESLKMPTRGAIERAAYLYAYASTLPQPAADIDRHVAASIAHIRRIPREDVAKAPISFEPGLHAFRKRPGVADALAGRPAAEVAPAPRARD